MFFFPTLDPEHSGTGRNRSEYGSLDDLSGACGNLPADTFQCCSYERDAGPDACRVEFYSTGGAQTQSRMPKLN